MYGVYFSLKGINKEIEQRLLTYLINNKYIMWVGTSSGRWHLGLTLVCRDIGHFNRILKSILNKYGNYINDYIVLPLIEEKYLFQHYLLEDSKNNINNSILDYKRDDLSFQKLLQETSKKTSIEKVELDKSDFKILRLLVKNSRCSSIDMAKKVGLSPNSINYRIRKMIKSGIITGFLPMISLPLLGLEWYMLFLQLYNLKEEDEKRLMAYAEHHPYILYLVKYAGEWNLELDIYVKDIAHFREVLRDLRDKFSNIIHSYDSLIMFGQHKFMYLLENPK